MVTTNLTFLLSTKHLLRVESVLSLKMFLKSQVKPRGLLSLWLGICAQLLWACSLDWSHLGAAPEMVVQALELQQESALET